MVISTKARFELKLMFLPSSTTERKVRNSTPYYIVGVMEKMQESKTKLTAHGSTNIFWM